MNFKVGFLFFIQVEDDASDLLLSSATTITHEGSAITKEIIAEQERIDPTGNRCLY